LNRFSTSLVLYRLFFHPLNQYPGPFLCKITRFVASWHVITRDSHEWMISLHKKVFPPTSNYLIKPNGSSMVIQSEFRRMNCPSFQHLPLMHSMAVKPESCREDPSMLEIPIGQQTLCFQHRIWESIDGDGRHGNAVLEVSSSESMSLVCFTTSMSSLLK
jgi:hypothetical protein